MMKIKAAAAKIAQERQRLSKRGQAANSMIAVEHEAVVQAKKAAADLHVADQKKLDSLTKTFNAKLKHEHDMSLKSQAKAAAVTARSKKVQEAIRKERLILKEEQAKAKNERKSWQNAVAAFKKEQKANAVAKGAFDESTKATAEKAQLEIAKAQQLAKNKDALLKQLKGQVLAEAKKFKAAARDWRRVKLSLMTRVRRAEASAHDANAKLAELAKEQTEDATAAGAKSAVKTAIHHAVASVKKAPPATIKSKVEEKSTKPIDGKVHGTAASLAQLDDEFDGFED